MYNKWKEKLVYLAVAGVIFILSPVLQSSVATVLTIAEFNQKFSEGLLPGVYMVRGFVADKSFPCPQCPPNAQCEPCPHNPHVLLSDNEEELFLRPSPPLQEEDVDKKLELLGWYVMTLRKDAQDSNPAWIAYQKEEKKVNIHTDKKGSTKTGTGIIKIASNPPRAHVFINYNNFGKTPVSANVHAGTMLVQVFLDVPDEKTRSFPNKWVRVKAGQTVDLGTIEFGKIEHYGKISISSEPSHAQVLLDGNLVPPPTPVTIKKNIIGTQHKITVSLPGYKLWSETFTMEKDRSFHIILRPDL